MHLFVSQVFNTSTILAVLHNFARFQVEHAEAQRQGETRQDTAFLQGHRHRVRVLVELESGHSSNRPRA